MADVFDPYHKWLGIAPSERPSTHYRLLGVALFESDVDVIQNGADQRMAHIRSFQAGSRAADAKKLLNELAQAAHCLLSEKERAAYDAQLRSTMRVAEPACAPLVRDLPNESGAHAIAAQSVPPPLRLSTSSARRPPVPHATPAETVHARIPHRPLAGILVLMIVAVAIFAVWSSLGPARDSVAADDDVNDTPLESSDSSDASRVSEVPPAESAVGDVETPPEGIPIDTSPRDLAKPLDATANDRPMSGIAPIPSPDPAPHGVDPPPESTVQPHTRPAPISDIPETTTLANANEQWLKAQLAIATRDTAAAKALLTHYVTLPDSSPHAEEARQLLDELRRLNLEASDNAVVLQKLTDEQLTALELKTGEVIPGVMLTNATLNEMYQNLLRPLVPDERQRRAALAAKANEGFRVWVSRDRKFRIDAKVVGMDGSNLIFQDRNKQESMLAWSRLNPGDQTLAIEAATAIVRKQAQTADAKLDQPRDPKRLHRLVSEFQRRSKLAQQVDQKRRELIALSRLTKDSKQQRKLLASANAYDGHIAMFRQELAALQLQIQLERKRQ